MILQCPGDDLRGGSRPAVHHYNNRILLAAVVAARGVFLGGFDAAAVADDHLVLLQKVPCHFNALIEQPARVFPKVEDETLNVFLTQALQVVFQFFAGVFLKLIDPHIGDARLQPESFRDARPGNLIADDIDGDRLRDAGTRHRHTHMRRARSLEQAVIAVVSRPSTLLPLTATIASPGRKPALYAGEPTKGATTTVRLPSGGQSSRCRSRFRGCLPAWPEIL